MTRRGFFLSALGLTALVGHQPTPKPLAAVGLTAADLGAARQLLQRKSLGAPCFYAIAHPYVTFDLVTKDGLGVGRYLVNG